MKLLIIGNGGREHAIAWKAAQSPLAEKIYVLPGNAGTARDFENVDLDPADHDACVAFAKDNGIDLAVIGPEAPLVAGLGDALREAGIMVFGPGAEGARFEGSKLYTKQFLKKYHIPTADYRAFDNLEDLLENLDTFGYPVVLKADGLAAGKGVLICKNREAAEAGARQIMQDRAFGNAGDTVVLEECLTGREASILCFVDGNAIVPMETAQDYKRAHDADEGLNTGGMGSYSPNVLFDDPDEKLLRRTVDRILIPTLEGFINEHIDFRGVLFVGLMIEDGEPKVLEFNVRFGDPETQSVLARLDTDLVEIMRACAQGRLDETEIQWNPNPAVSVVLASGGYPESYEKGKKITGLEDVDGAVVFHAGTRPDGEDVLTDGGRVLAVTATGPSVSAAREKVYEEIKKIDFDGAFCRSDIAADVK